MEATEKKAVSLGEALRMLNELDDALSEILQHDPEQEVQGMARSGRSTASSPSRSNTSLPIIR